MALSVRIMIKVHLLFRHTSNQWMDVQDIIFLHGSAVGFPTFMGVKGRKVRVGDHVPFTGEALHAEGTFCDMTDAEALEASGMKPQGGW